MTTATLRRPLQRPPLRRPHTAVLGGVCAGVARHLGWPVRRTRFLAFVLAALGGFGALLYLWLWALVPLDEADDAPAVTRSVPVAALLDVFALVAALTVPFYRSGGGPATTPLVAVTLACAAAVAWSLGFDRSDPHRTPRYIRVTRYAGIVILVATGLESAVFSRTNSDVIVGFIMIALGAGFLAAPRIVALWTDLLAERATRVRQEQRAEIAAHLHDSVLQTLALIQNRAGASSEVARIARAQERELRDWLFTGDSPGAIDLATELRDIAAAVELDYPVRIEFVTAGDTVGLASSALVAAAREAMLNAARHAGGEVSVYLEHSPAGTDVFIRDRGRGVDLASLPDDRLGIRESIIGRMARAGGTATVRPGSGGLGTEVHLHLEATHA